MRKRLLKSSQCACKLLKTSQIVAIREVLPYSKMQTVSNPFTVFLSGGFL
jgi:hypothetical protein